MLFNNRLKHFPVCVLERWPPGTATWNVEEEREKAYHRRDVERFFSQQTTAKLIADEIKVIRKSGGAKRIDFDFGEPVDEDLLRSSK